MFRYFLAVSALSCSLIAEIPYAAKYTRTVTVTDAVSGRVLRDQKVLGIQRRSSDHSQITEYGEAGAAQQGRLIDGRSLRQYSLDFIGRRAFQEAVLGAPPSVSLRNRKDASVGTRIISGLFCTGFPVREGTKDGRQVGTAWVSLEHGILVRMEQEMVVNGTKRTSIMELSEFRFGQEQSIGMPAGFQVLDIAKPQACPTCSSQP